MNRKAYFQIIFILAIVCACLLYIFNRPKNSDPILTKDQAIELIDFSKVPQPDTYFVAKPRQMHGYKNNIYILDQKFSRILVFKETGLSHTIGGPGEGPGEFLNADSFDISKDIIYVLNKSSRIEVFDVSGKFIRTIQLKKPAPYADPSDIKAHENFLFVGYNIGETKVQRYDLKGDLIDDFIRGGNSIESGKYIISDPISMCIFPGKQSLILFNRFNGNIEIYDLINGTLLNTIENKDPAIRNKISKMKENLSRQNYDDNSKEIKSIIMWRCSFDVAKSRLLMIPSQLSVSESERSGIIYSLDLNLETQSSVYFTVEGKRKIIRDCCSFQGKYAILDYNLNIFLGG